MTPPTFTKGIGRLALSRYDAQLHFEGQAFRHTADQTDVLNPTLVYGSPANVEQALENLNSFIITQINAGQGFCVVGDGYNTWHAANGTINFDTTIPSLDTILNPVFSAIINGTPLPAAFQRIKYGGIVLIKAGVYIVKQTINIPPGITLIGENYGTKIINATGMNTSTVPPTFSGSPAPVFGILADGYRSMYSGFNGGADYAVDPNLFMFSREARIYSMVIADNFVEPTELGDTFYKLPQNKTSISSLNPPPLISQQLGSSLSLYGVVGMGRANFSSGKTVSSITGSFIGIDGSTADTETFCKIDSCFFDGFSIPINLATTSFNDGYALDFLEITNARMRSYGYYNGDSVDGYANTTIKCNMQNISISDSLFYGNATNVSSLVYLTTVPNSAPALQDRSKIVVVGNQVIIDKTSSDNSVNSTWVPLYFSSAIAAPNNYMTSLVYGNDFQDTFDVYVNDGYQYSGSGIGLPQLSINAAATTTTLRNNTVTVDGYSINLVGNTNMTSIVGNNFMNNSASLQLLGGSVLEAGVVHLTGSGLGSALFDAGSTFTLNAKTALNQTATATHSGYTIDSGAHPDLIILCDSTGGAVSVTLPAPTMGRLLFIFDWAGDASSNPIAIHPHASETIDNRSSIAIINGYSSVILWSDGVNWFVIASAISAATY